jgi:hypothetical protein
VLASDIVVRRPSATLLLCSSQEGRKVLEVTKRRMVCTNNRYINNAASNLAARSLGSYKIDSETSTELGIDTKF